MKINFARSLFFATGIIWISGFLVSCGKSKNQADVDNIYIKEIEEWHTQRIQRLKKPTGWLSLAGLFWLKDSRNSFGSDSSNNIIFPKDKAPSVIGSFFLKDGKISVKIKPGVEVFCNQKPVTEMQLIDDTRDNTTILMLGSLSWYIIKRGEQYGVRLKDSESPLIKHFKGIETYPIDPKWHLKAHLVPRSDSTTISVPNILGKIDHEISPGTLEFEIDGQIMHLDPVIEQGSDEYFIIFADQTNGEETYDAGRFIYCPQVDSTGYTYIDFNKAYNPPCTFTPYATCPLPPSQNRLSIKVTAGEKKYEEQESLTKD